MKTIQEIIMQGYKSVVNSFSQRSQIKAVNTNPSAILSIKNPSESVQIAAIMKEPYNIHFINNPSEKVQMTAIQQNPALIRHIAEPTENVQLAAVNQNPDAILHIENPSEAVRILAVEQKPSIILHIENPSETLCKLAIEKEFPGNKIDYSLSTIETKNLFEKIKDIETVQERMKILESFKSNITTEMNSRIVAIQVLEGNSPEQIFEEKFISVNNQFPLEGKQLKESINDSESGIIYRDSRMLSDNHFKKVNIQGSSQYFADQIKKTLTTEDLLTFSKELKSPSNLPLGKTVTAEEALDLFKNEYIQKIKKSAVFENEQAGKYEIQKPTIQYKFKSEELLRAGTHPYSPNYKEAFEKAGLKQEFETFEKACCEKAQWEHSYNFAVTSHDIPDVNDLERKLPILNKKIENSRDIVYNKLNDLYFNIEIRKNIENKLSHKETESLGSMQRTGSISYQEEDLLRKFNFSAEKEELKEFLADRELGADNDGELYSNEAKVRMKAGHILEENGLLPKGTTIHELTKEGWKHGFIKDVQVKLEMEASSSGNLINTSAEKTGNDLATQMQDLKDLTDNYRNLGYDSVAEAINKYAPNYVSIAESGSSLNYKIENVEIQSVGAKKLYGDIVISKADGKTTAALENLCIKDKSTGLTEPFHTNGIDISKQPADTVKKLLSGGKVQTSSLGITQVLGLNKTPLGWGISIGKQIFNTVDSSASIG